MSNSIKVPTIGETFTTKNGGYTGTVESVKQNATGSYRVKLLLPNGDTRYTTHGAKQFDCGGLAKMSDPCDKIILITTYK